jgi:hypothetical protein
MSSGYVNLPPSGAAGSSSYKSAVTLVSDLPASGNTQGDEYLVTSTGYNYFWDGSAWQKVNAPIGSADVANTNSVNLTVTAKVLTADAQISSNAADALNQKVSLDIQSATSKGLRAQIPNASITGLFSATAPITYSAGAIAVTSSNLTEATSAVLTITGGTGVLLGGTGATIQVKQASTSVSGYLSNTDWNTFNGKQAAGNYITALTGDVAATGPGSVAATIQPLAVTNAKIANSTIDLTTKVTGALPLANLANGTANQIIGANSAATGNEFKTLAVGTAGSNFAIAHTANTVTFNLPDAGTGARGAVTTGAQTFGGSKSLGGAVTDKTTIGLSGSTVAHQINGGISRTVRTLSATTLTLDTTTADDIILCNPSAAQTITLTAAATAGTGRVITIKDVSGNAQAFNITLTPNGTEKIDGQSNYVIVQNYASIELVSNGSNWFVL